MGRWQYRLNGPAYVNGVEDMTLLFADDQKQQTFDFFKFHWGEKISYSQIKSIQILSGANNNDVLIRAGTGRKILAGWYTVKYKIFLHPIHVLEARRNRLGFFCYRFYPFQVPEDYY